MIVWQHRADKFNRIEIAVVLADGKESTYVPPALPKRALGKKYLKRIRNRIVQRDRSHRTRNEQTSY